MKYTIDNLPAKIEWEKSGALSRTLQNAKNLLLTRMGEVPYSRTRGLDQAVYDMSMSRLNAVMLDEAQRVMLWEPDVQVVAVRCDQSEGYLRIEVDLEIADTLTDA